MAHVCSNGRLLYTIMEEYLLVANNRKRDRLSGWALENNCPFTWVRFGSVFFILYSPLVFDSSSSRAAVANCVAF